jgi:hypothetical protein
MEKNDVPVDAPVSDRNPPRCVDCTAVAPPTGTNYTLIGSRFGWRLTRSRTPSGRKVMEWRCPTCYARMRAKDDP